MLKRFFAFGALTVFVFAGCGAAQQSSSEEQQNITQEVEPPHNPNRCLKVKERTMPWLAGLSSTIVRAITEDVLNGVVLVKYDGCGAFEMLNGCFLSAVEYKKPKTWKASIENKTYKGESDFESWMPILVARHDSDYSDATEWTFESITGGVFVAPSNLKFAMTANGRWIL